MNSAFPDPILPRAPASRPRIPSGDGELLREFAASRSEAAFRELVARHAGLVLAAARRRLGGDAAGLAEDAAQQTFIALARNPSRAAKAPSLGAWLHRAAVFEAGNLLRGEARHRVRNALAATVTADGPDAAEVWEGAEPHLDEALAALPETDRALLVLHHLEGRSYAEAAARLGCSATAAQRRGHRALARLSAQLRRRGVNLPAAALAAGLGSALVPAGSNAAAHVLTALSSSLVIRALGLESAAAAATAGTGAGMGGMLGALLSTPLLGTATVLLALAVTWALARHSQSDRLAPQETAASTGTPGFARNRLPSPQGPSGLDLPRGPAQPSFEMAAPDEKLTEDERAFVALAKADTAAAVTWARKKFPSAEALRSFITGAFSTSGAGRALADRDLRAADRLLEATLPGDFGIFDSILNSRLARNFETAIAWADSWNLSHSGGTNPSRGQAPFLSYLNFDSGDWRPDIPKALAASRSIPVRQSLLHMECERLTAENEERLKPLADSLSGEERQLVLEYHLSVLLKRGDPGAAEALAEIRPGRLHGTREIAMRGPELVLDYQMARPVDYSDPLYQTVGQLAVDWARLDAQAARDWAAAHSDKELQDHGFMMLKLILQQEGGLR